MTDPLVVQLDATGVPYEILACDPELADTAQFCAAYGYGLEQSANTILVIGKGAVPLYAACVVLATTRLDVNNVVRKRFGVKKASFAMADDTVALTGMQLGGVTPFGLPSDLTLWVDARVMACEKVILGGGSRDRKVLASPETLIAVGGVVVDGLAKDLQPDVG
jgi:prolyl-tRNA editing enzyme YbaK/EbsC (Cys-tRNA(Pro) deacylase)